MHVGQLRAVSLDSLGMAAFIYNRLHYMELVPGSHFPAPVNAGTLLIALIQVCFISKALERTSIIN